MEIMRGANARISVHHIMGRPLIYPAGLGNINNWEAHCD